MGPSNPPLAPFFMHMLINDLISQLSRVMDSFILLFHPMDYSLSSEKQFWSEDVVFSKVIPFVAIEMILRRHELNIIL